jgi:hypothetical protein
VPSSKYGFENGQVLVSAVLQKPPEPKERLNAFSAVGLEWVCLCSWPD